MTANHLSKALHHLRRVLRPPGSSDLTDDQLLARFVSNRDETAFTELVRRHGPLVLGVCRRILRHTQDAEDAFQAAFLVLARKAASVVNRQAIGSWLYRVTYRIALEAKNINYKRRSREKQVEEMPHPEVAPIETKDWIPRLDYELNLLPEHYRAVIVACDLEGRSRKEVARNLGLSEGTVSSRLARGRCLLAKRLSRYGLSLSVGALTAGMAEGTASVHVPVSLLAATTKTVVGQAVLSSSVEILMKGALKTMLLSKLKLAVGSVMVMVALTASGLVYRASGQSAPATGERSKPRTELEALRHENELLKLNLEVVLEKVRAQEAELRTLRGQVKTPANALGVAVADLNIGADVIVKVIEQKNLSLATVVSDRLHDPLQEAEAALKALREARDTEAQRKAADALERALKELREQQKKPDARPPGK